MNQLVFGGLLLKPAPRATIVGIAFIVLFAVVGIIVGPDYDERKHLRLESRKMKAETNLLRLTSVVFYIN
tara:strand:- start:53 stop:262 length:210 start_codon:yes stop_codon:yes gene_type:complete